MTEDDLVLEGEPRSWLRYAILSAAEADAHARGYELNAMAIEEEPECLDLPGRKPREERAAFYRSIAATYRIEAAKSRTMVEEERAAKRRMFTGVDPQ